MTNEEAAKTLRKIQREVLKDTWTDKCYDMAIEALSADRPKGEWIYNKEKESNFCSVCNHEALCVTNVVGLDWELQQLSNYCPNCGAYMVKDDDIAD